MNGRADLLPRFQRFCEQNNLIPPEVKVIVAVSGGVDSMTLLDLILRNATRWRIKVGVAHLHHRLRGILADEDAEFVREYCARLGVEYFYREVDVRQYAQERRLSIELAGRELRYAFFMELVEQHKPALIATGHTADDVAETVLLNLVKGKGLAGLGGIPVKRRNIVRPILFALKEEVYAYARWRNLPFREDHTNRLPTAQRNVIRNQLLPLIEQQINPRVKITLWEHSLHWRAVQEYITEQAQKAWQTYLTKHGKGYLQLERNGLQKLPSVLLREVLLQCLEQLAGNYVEVPFQATNRFIQLVQGNARRRQVQLSRNYLAYVEVDQVLIIERRNVFDEELLVTVGQPLTTEYFVFRAEVAPLPTESQPQAAGKSEFIDLDKIRFPLKLRPWRAGDRLVPLGMKGHKKVSDILTDKKIPAPLKKRIPLLVSGEQIIWVCGLVLADDCKLTAATRRVLHLYFEERL